MPWLKALDYRILAWLFGWLPHTDPRMNFAEFFIYNPLASFWIPTAACYFHWRIEDQRAAWRRGVLIENFFAGVCGVLLTLLARPWIGAVSPARSADFQTLYPRYLWGSGNENSFPSHSTLVYFAIAAGLWPFSKKWSIALGAWVLVAISLPRVYMGGHYPSDVAGAILLALGFLWLARQAGKVGAVKKLYASLAAGGVWSEVLLFLVLFELAEGFQASREIVHAIMHGVNLPI